MINSETIWENINRQYESDYTHDYMNEAFLAEYFSSLPVFRYELGVYTLAFFCFRKMKPHPLTIKYMNPNEPYKYVRPDYWYTADIETGEILSSHRTFNYDFSAVPKGTEYRAYLEAHAKKANDIFKKALRSFDTIRTVFLQTGELPVPLYEEYLQQIRSRIPDEYHTFYKELGVDTTKKLPQWDPRNRYNITTEPFNKYWVPQQQLYHLSDQQLQEAEQFLKEGKWKRNVLTKFGEKLYQISVFFEEGVSCGAGSFAPHETTYAVRTVGTFAPLLPCEWKYNKSCLRSNNNMCIPLVAGYIQFLKDNNRYEEALAERARYIQKKGGLAKRVYKYSWNISKESQKRLIELNPVDFETAAAIADFELALPDTKFSPSPDKQDHSGQLKLSYWSFPNCCSGYGNTPVIIQDIAQKKAQGFKSNWDGVAKKPASFTSPGGADSYEIIGKEVFLKGPDLTDLFALTKNDCPECRAPLCHCKIAAYLRYLKDTDIDGFDRLISAREMLLRRLELKQKGILDPKSRLLYWGSADFEPTLVPEAVLKIKMLLRKATKTMLEEAMWLVEKRKISLPLNMEDPDNDENLYLMTAYPLQKNPPLDSNDTKKIRNFLRADHDLGFENDFEDTAFSFPNWEIANFPAGSAVFILAAAIEYLIRMNIDFQQELDARIDYVSTMEEQKELVQGIDSIIRFAQNEKANFLACIIQGENEKKKKEIIKQITGALSDAGKISMGGKNAEMTLQLTAVWLSHNKEGHAEKKYLPENELFVLTELSEFVEEYKFYRDRIELEDTRRCYRHMVDVLGSVRENTYLIITSNNEKETQSFLELNEKFIFLYGKNLVVINNMPFEELYEKYYRGLSESVREQITDVDQNKQGFLDFIALNEKFLPFNNEELANYLSNYSNINNAPMLPPDIYDRHHMDASLDDIVGMHAIKQQVREFENYISFQKKMAVHGGKVSLGNLHMQFLGNPGTGKTTIARILVSMLYSLGILKENKLVEVERKDLVSGYAGQTAMKTSEKINEALGGVLFVDEAYSLFNSDTDSFGKEAIATLIKAMEDHKNELVVIFAGYEEEMQTFLKANPGIESRIGYNFRFSDYSPEELTEIFRRSIVAQGFTCSEKAYEQVKELCEYYSRRKNFGNGRFAKKIEQQAIIKHAQNMNDAGWELTVITDNEIPSIEDLEPRKDAAEKTVSLENQIGLKQVKLQMQKFRDRLEFENKAKQIGIRLPKGNSHMLFIGNAGTGKTTVARIIASELYQAGMISTDKCIECSRKDLIGQHVGETAPKTQDVIERALGGVLFIDEAYALSSGGDNDFGREAIVTLIKAMEDHRDDFVCIFSGYEKEMKAFLNTNPGIASRIAYTFHFEDFSAAELAQIFAEKIKKAHLQVSSPAMEKVFSVMQYFCSVPNFGNGRFAERLSQLTYELHAECCKGCNDKDRLMTIEPEDVPSIEDVIRLLPDGNTMVKPARTLEGQHSRTAYHELGHAVIRILLLPSTAIGEISISEEGGTSLEFESYDYESIDGKTASELEAEICCKMTGIASEQLFMGEYSNGGTSDLSAAAQIANAMITRFGMSSNGFFIGDANDEYVHRETNAILNAQFERAKQLLNARGEIIQKAHQHLLQHKTISAKELAAILP